MTREEELSELELELAKVYITDQTNEEKAYLGLLMKYGQSRQREMRSCLLATYLLKEMVNKIVYDEEKNKKLYDVKTALFSDSLDSPGIEYTIIKKGIFFIRPVMSGSVFLKHEHDNTKVTLDIVLEPKLVDKEKVVKYANDLVASYNKFPELIPIMFYLTLGMYQKEKEKRNKKDK